MYLRDPAFRKNRTMTIARERVSDTTVKIAYCINLIEKSEMAWQDEGYVPKEVESDIFSKKRGRQIATARLEQGKVTHIITRKEDGRFEEAILQFLQDDAPHYFAKKIGKYHLQLLEIREILAKID